jgi:hypothetical protein
MLVPASLVSKPARRSYRVLVGFLQVGVGDRGHTYVASPVVRER